MALYLLAIVTLLLIGCPIGAHTVSFTAVTKADDSALASLLPTEFFLTTLALETDSACSPQEFFYLMGVTPPAQVTRAAIEHGLYALYKKNIFSSLSLDVIHHHDGYALTVHAPGAWVVKDITIRGGSLAQRYRHLYTIAVGDQYDEAHHEQVVQEMKRQIVQRGYLNAIVRDHLIYDPKGKTVAINIDINWGPAFNIDRCTVILNNDRYRSLLTSTEHSINKKYGNKRYRTKTEHALTRELEALLIQQGFISPQVSVTAIPDYTHATVQLQCCVVLNDRYQYFFVGNHGIDSTQLLACITAKGYAGLLPLEFLVNEIKQCYIRRGYFQVAVRVCEDNGSCTFTITEGKRSRIAAIQLIGPRCIEAHWLEKRFLDTLRERWYDQERIERTVAHLRRYYEGKGFIEVQIQHTAIPVEEGASDAPTVVLRVNVVEGKQYIVGAMRYDHPLGAQQPEHSWGVVPFSAEYIKEHRQLLLDKLRLQGYLYATVDAVYTVHDAVVDIDWHIVPGPLVTFGRTVIQGPAWIDSSYILARLKHQEGQPFSLHTLEQSVDALRALEFFDTITIVPDIADARDVSPLVVLKLIPDDPFEVRARFGIAQVSKNFAFRDGTTYTVGASGLYKNPFGIADQLRFDADMTRFEHHEALQYSFPLKLMLPLKGTVKLYDAFYKQPLFQGSEQTLYAIGQRGLLGGLTIQHASVTAGISYGIEWMKITDVCLASANLLDFQPTLVNKTMPVMVIEPTVLVQYDADPLMPRWGFTTLISGKGVMPWYMQQASSGFMRLLFEQAGFIRITGPVSIAGRVRLGHVFNQSFKSILPPERFYLGGAYSVRGYEPDHVPPLSRIEDRGAYVMVPRGGRSMANLNTELRCDIGKYCTVALFTDVGALQGDTWHDMHWVGATGGGVRVKTPIGIIRFDIGFKWKPTKYESSCAWFITLGNPF